MTPAPEPASLTTVLEYGTRRAAKGRVENALWLTLLAAQLSLVLVPVYVWAYARWWQAAHPYVYVHEWPSLQPKAVEFFCLYGTALSWLLFPLWTAAACHARGRQRAWAASLVVLHLLGFAFQWSVDFWQHFF